MDPCRIGVRADVLRGRRGESWQRARGAAARDGVSRVRRGDWWMMRA